PTAAQRARPAAPRRCGGPRLGDRSGDRSRHFFFGFSAAFAAFVTEAVGEEEATGVPVVVVAAGVWATIVPAGCGVPSFGAGPVAFGSCPRPMWNWAGEMLR